MTNDSDPKPKIVSRALQLARQIAKDGGYTPSEIRELATWVVDRETHGHIPNGSRVALTCTSFFTEGKTLKLGQRGTVVRFSSAQGYYVTWHMGYLEPTFDCFISPDSIDPLEDHLDREIKRARDEARVSQEASATWGESVKQLETSLLEERQLRIKAEQELQLTTVELGIKAGERAEALRLLKGEQEANARLVSTTSAVQHKLKDAGVLMFPEGIEAGIDTLLGKLALYRKASTSESKECPLLNPDEFERWLEDHAETTFWKFDKDVKQGIPVPMPEGETPTVRKPSERDAFKMAIRNTARHARLFFDSKEKRAQRAEETAPVPMLLWCPMCGARHIDEGEFATKVHHTHACQNPECGLVWRPAVVPTTGVKTLPGFYNGEVMRAG